MNLVLLEPPEVGPGNRVEVSGRRARHIRSVLRARAGDELRVGVVRGPVGTARIIELGCDADPVVLETRLDKIAPRPPTIELVLAVPRPKAMSRVLEAAASLGVRRIDLVNAWRVDKSYLSSRRLEPDALSESLRLGCEQGGLTWVPEVAVHSLLVPFLRDELGPRLGLRDTVRRLIAHPRAGVGIESAIPAGDDAPVSVAIGPEGGWVETELASFAELGFEAVSIGPRILRVENAVPVILAVIDLLRRLDR